MAPSARPGIVIGLDVGKSSHWACVLTREGEVLESAAVPNREGAIDAPYARHPGALVVVDQVRNIGSLALSRAGRAGMPRAYLPGLAAHGVSRFFASDAKTDECDAMAVAKTALGIPDALLPVADRRPEIEAARSLAAQRDFLTCKNTRNKNRLRSILPESRPGFEARAAQSAIRHVDIVGVRFAAGQQEAEEPAHILVQPPCAKPWPMGNYYAECRGMPHGKAIKALARKRLEVIYAVMRDKTTYSA